MYTHLYVFLFLGDWKSETAGETECVSFAGLIE